MNDKNAYRARKKSHQAVPHDYDPTLSPTANKIPFSGIDEIGTKEWCDYAMKDLETMFSKVYSKFSTATIFLSSGNL